MLRNFAAVFAGLALAGASSAALAHGKLLSASPPVGGEVTGSPSEIRITFSEGIFPKFSGAVLKDSAGHVVKTGTPGVDASKKQLVVPVAAPLARGAYQVDWHVVCEDTHRMHGEYGFVVK